jgi:hypothetical protein
MIHFYFLFWKVLFEAIEKSMNVIFTLGDETTDIILTTKVLKSNTITIYLIFTIPFYTFFQLFPFSYSHTYDHFKPQIS